MFSHRLLFVFNAPFYVVDEKLIKAEKSRRRYYNNRYINKKIEIEKDKDEGKPKNIEPNISSSSPF